jgi:hypothetical protein|tara:strand:- start:238 stop:525 length:288 start_codon:yes stop_codon:yes gene_type:complete
MALTKTTEEDRLEIVGTYKLVQIRQATIIKEDGKELSRTFHRRVLNPGKLDSSNNLVDTDISGESSEVQSVCNAVWTTTVKDAWKDKLIADESAP